MGLGQYDSLREYCGPHTASSVFLIFTTQSYSYLCNYDVTFPYIDKREVLQQDYTKTPILPCPHFRWVVNKYFLSSINPNVYNHYPYLFDYRVDPIIKLLVWLPLGRGGGGRRRGRVLARRNSWTPRVHGLLHNVTPPPPPHPIPRCWTCMITITHDLITLLIPLV